MSIAVIGSTMVDLVTYIDRMPREGETLEAPEFVLGHGGKGANQAVAARRLGSEVLLLTRVGKDLFAEGTLENFRNEGLDTRWVLPTDAPSGVAPIFVDRESKNSIIIVQGANGHLSPADVEAAAEDLAACSLIVLQLEVPLETVYAAVEFGRSHGIPVLVNPAPAQPGLEIEGIAGADWFVPNEHELAMLHGTEPATDQEIEAAARDLLRRGRFGNVVVTLGEAGALWVREDGTERIPSPVVAAADTTGAGDAFIGCLAHHLHRGTEPGAALRKAAAYAADSVTRRGTQTSYARAEDVPELA